MGLPCGSPLTRAKHFPLPHRPLSLVSDRPHRLRQYAGLALVIIAYVGGIIGWSCAVLEVDNQSSSAADTTQAHRTHAESLPVGAPRLVAPPIAQSPPRVDARGERRPAPRRAQNSVGGDPAAIVPLHRSTVDWDELACRTSSRGDGAWRRDDLDLAGTTNGIV